MVYLGGGEQRAINEAEMRQPVPEKCGGPYWRMGQFLPEEYLPNAGTDLPPTPLAEGWELYTVPDLNLSLAYPTGWYVHDAGKALQITPNSQPIWSSYADPAQPNDGPYFDLLHNLNRSMAATPLAEIDNIIAGYETEIEAVEPAAPLATRPDVAVGVYRFVEFEDEMVLLLGAAVNPVPDSPQPTIALTAVVRQDELAEMQPIFEAVLRSLRPADAPSIGLSNGA